MPEQYLKDIASFALTLVGCGYIYGATGWICTAERVEQQAQQYPEYASVIRKYGLSLWLNKPCYDCAQVTRAAARKAGISIPSGATSQWNADVWESKGMIDTLPDDPTGCFIYRQSGGKMQHTGVCVGGGLFVDARGHAYGVLKTALTAYKWTHWARLRKPETEQAQQQEGVKMDYSQFAGKTVTPANLKEGTTKLIIRAEADGNAAILCRAQTGETLQCVSVAGEWALCLYNDVRGYVMAKYLAQAGNSTGEDARYTALEARVAALEKLVVGSAGTVG